MVRLPNEFHLENKSLYHNTYSDNDLIYLEDVNCLLNAYIWLNSKISSIFIEKELALLLKETINRIIESIIENKYYNAFEFRVSEKKENNDGKNNELIFNNNYDK